MVSVLFMRKSSEKTWGQDSVGGVLAAKPDDLSSIPGSHMMEEESPQPRGTLQPPHTGLGTISPYTYTHMNSCSFLNVIFFTSAFAFRSIYLF